MKKIILLLSIFFIGVNIVYGETVKFSDCVDGDTIKVLIDKKERTVRLLAVDTPESVHPTKGVEYYGKEASDYTCKMIKEAKKITLEYDADSDKEDKYERLLAWVFVDGELLQEKLIENGYAKLAYLYGDYKYTKELEKVQEEASAKEIGIWNTTEAEKYNSSSSSSDDSTSDDSEKYSTYEIIVIVILLLIVLFVGDKSVKKKAKKKLKGYLK